MPSSPISRRTALAAGSSVVAVASLAACSGSANTPSAESTAAPTTTPSGPTVIATVSQVPVGTSFAFTNPNDGMPGFVVQPAAGTFLAYSAVCTHEGCIVNATPAGYLCPCHGAQYDAQGSPTQGPARTPLASIAVTVDGDNILLA